MAVVTTRQLLEAGMHFGHQTRRWNPKMRRFILGERNGIYIIDLNKTLAGLEEAYGYVRDLVAKGGIVLFVGTKKQTQGPIATYARACGMPFVNERWLGGMLTNFTTISSRTGKLREYEAMERAGDFDAMPKKEGLKHRRELEKLRRNLGGIRDLDRLPDTVFVIDTKKEHIAVTEANKLGLPVVAVVDTNCDPDVIDYVIPGNDDAIRAGRLMCRVIADAVAEGRFIAQRRAQAAHGGPRVGDAAAPPVPPPPPPPPPPPAPSGERPAAASAAPAPAPPASAPGGETSAGSEAAVATPAAPPAAAPAAAEAATPGPSGDPESAPAEPVAAAGGETEEGFSSGSADRPATGSGVAPDSANGNTPDETVDASVED